MLCATAAPKSTRVTVLDVKAALEANAYLLPKMNQIGAHLMRQQQPLGPRLSDESTPNSSSNNLSVQVTGCGGAGAGSGGGGGLGSGSSPSGLGCLGLGLGTADDSFSGSLYLTVHRLVFAPESFTANSLTGEQLDLEQLRGALDGVFLSVEVDSFGQFFFQAKTPARALCETLTWDEQGAHTVQNTLTLCILNTLYIREVYECPFSK